MSRQLSLEDEATFRDRIPTVTEKGKRNWIYAWQPHGRLYKWRSALSVLYVVLFFSLPFIKINGNPALQLNVIEGKFAILGTVFWPQDFFIFGLGMITFIVFVVLFTIIYGRVFCGWACPQTIFMEMIFRRIEWWIEGNPNQQRTHNRGPWTTNKVLRKAAKHISFFLLSFVIANTFLAYIIGVPALFDLIASPISSNFSGFVAMLFFTGAFYAVYAHVREIVCTVICPYGRLQGVLLDQNSIVVAYDYNRGEPRGKGKRPATGLGDCIDCKQCVVVCPTGIDIRNGTQLECINCTACIDACDSVMDKIGQPKGLVRYASENQIKEWLPFIFTAKMKVYTGILVALMAVLTYLLATRNDVGVNILRVQGQMFQEVGADSLSNLYSITVINKSAQQKKLQVKVDGVPASVKMVGMDQLVVDFESQAQATFFITLPKSAIKDRETKLSIGVYEADQEIERLNTSFLGYVQQ
jgi:cytochrome c oxidase accessory protein FixG